MHQSVNPYSASHKRKVAVASRTGAPLTNNTAEVPRGQFGTSRAGTPRESAMPIVAANGEFNAGSKREVMQAIQTLHSMFNTGEVKARYQDAGEIKEVRAAQEHRLSEAWNDRTGQAWVALGEVMGD